MKLKIWYSVQNGGDGSAYPIWMESEELAEWHQRNMDEGWGEPCTGYIEVQSDSKITVCEKLTTIEDLIERREERLEWALKYNHRWGPNPDSIRREIKELEEMKENRI